MGRDPNATTVKEIMSTNIKTIGPLEEIEDALRIFKEHNIKNHKRGNQQSPPLLQKLLGNQIHQISRSQRTDNHRKPPAKPVITENPHRQHNNNLRQRRMLSISRNPLHQSPSSLNVMNLIENHASVRRERRREET